MYEHEIKFEVKNLKDLTERLKKEKVVFSGSKHQVDNVWISKDADGTNLVSGLPVVRTREEGGKVILTLKIELAHGTFEEHETEVGSLEETEHILECLGMRKLVEIDKDRKFAKFENYNLCLDNVKNLGNFMEIEIVTKTENQNAKENIIALAKKFGLGEENILKNTYNTLLCRKFNLK